MIDDLTNDPMMRLVGTLEHGAPDPARAERIRARCHRSLAARAAGRDEQPGRVPAALAVACAVYLAAIAWQTVVVLLAWRPA